MPPAPLALFSSLHIIVDIFRVEIFCVKNIFTGGGSRALRPCPSASTLGHGGRVSGTPSYGYAAVGGGEAAVAAYIADFQKKKKNVRGAGAGGYIVQMASTTRRQSEAERLMLLSEVDAAAAAIKARCDQLASRTARAAAGRAT